jgi:hypothetical protein
LRLEKRRSICCGESGSGGGCRSPAYWEQRHRCSCLLVLVRVRLSTGGVGAETGDGVMRTDGLSRGWLQ